MSDPRPAFRAYRAPREHGQALIEPRLEAAGELLRENMAVARNYGPGWESLRRTARDHLVRTATEYTAAYRDVSWFHGEASEPIVMAGHQPEIFHPGVWFKNFALSEIAARWSAIPINLVVDNDVASGTSIRAITSDASSGRPRFVSVPYDSAAGGVPYEQREILDRSLFDSFAQRYRDAVAGLVDDPCVDPLWRHAIEAVERCGVAGCTLAQARHGLEGELGLKTLEVPLGSLCRGSAFAEFLLMILSELPRFQRCYNDSADHYRAHEGIRSSAHPVPNLGQHEDWFEAPLWIYGDDAPVRRAAWARLSNHELILSDRTGRSNGTAGHDGNPGHELRIDMSYPRLAAEQLAAAFSPTFKLRPRALLTTMYARLVLSDLFVHGIGGAKYDQLGDMITRSFFAIEPPRFMVISATLRLPGAGSVEHHGEPVQRLKRAIRDTRYQGERFADQVDLDPTLLEEKRRLLQQVPPRGHRKAWHDRLTRINEAFSDALAEVRMQLQQQLNRAERDAASQAVLASREHPLCLFPIEYLTAAYRKMLKDG